MRSVSSDDRASEPWANLPEGLACDPGFSRAGDLSSTRCRQQRLDSPALVSLFTDQACLSVLAGLPAPVDAASDAAQDRFEISTSAVDIPTRHGRLRRSR